MAEVNNTIAIDFKVDTTALKAIKSQLDVFKSSLSGMSAPELFNVSDSINNNISALQNQISTNNEVFNSLRNLTHAEMELNDISKEDKSSSLKLLSKESQTAAMQLRVAKDSASILQQQLNAFGGTRANFEFIKTAAERLGYTFNAVAKQMQQLSLVAMQNGTVMNRATGQILTQAKALNVLRSSMYKFNMNILSVMFGMMALNRYLMGFARSAITTYQTANDESTQLGKATWELQAAWEFLKYSLVDALTQSELFNWFIKAVLNLVNAFNELDKGKKAIIAIALAVLIAFTAVSLLYTQLQPMFALLSSKALTAGFTALATAVGGVGVLILIIAGILAAVILLWTTDLGGFRDFVKETFGIIFITIVQYFGHVYNWIANILKMIVAIFKGDWEAAAGYAVEALKHAAAGIIKLLLGLGAAMMNIFSWVGNATMDILVKVLLGGFLYLLYLLETAWIKFSIFLIEKFSDSIDKVIGFLNKLINTWNNTVGAFTGMKIPTFKMASEQVTDLNEKLKETKKIYDESKKGLDDFSSRAKVEYITSDDIKQKMSGVDDLFGFTKEVATTSAKTAAASTENPLASILNINSGLDVLNGSLFKVSSESIPSTTKSIQELEKEATVSLKSISEATAGKEFSLASQIDGNPGSLTDSLDISSLKWTEMATNASNKIDNINTKLATIPRDIYTYHHIVTVYE